MNFGGCSMTEVGDRSLESAVEEFDLEISTSLSVFAGSCPPFEYSWLDAGRNVSVSIRFQQHSERPGILPLLSKGKAVIGIKPEYRCTWDSTKRFLAVQSSSFAVHPYAKPGLDPLFRVEYLRGSNGKYPTSHLHVHAHRDEFTHLLGFATKLDTRKSAQVNNYRRDQAVNAPRLMSCSSISRGVAPPRTCRGVSLSSFCTQATCSGVTVAKSVPFL